MRGDRLVVVAPGGCCQWLPVAAEKEVPGLIAMITGSSVRMSLDSDAAKFNGRCVMRAVRLRGIEIAPIGTLPGGPALPQLVMNVPPLACSV